MSLFRIRIKYLGIKELLNKLKSLPISGFGSTNMNKTENFKKESVNGETFSIQTHEETKTVSK